MAHPLFMGRVPSFTARIVTAERLTNSVNGNPRFKITFDDGERYITSTDAACSYDVENLLGRRGEPSYPVHVWLTKAGRIEGLSRS